MPYTLTTTQATAYQVAGYQVMSYMVDNDNLEIHIHYVELDDQGARQREGDITLSGPDFTAAQASAQSYIDAGDNYYVASKNSVYDMLVLKLGSPSGTVT
ncbi:MAG: hypothetical protein ACU843_07465 [Gammaproteobacteria bacterium]